MSGREMVVQRPVPGEPRPYEFPTTFRTMLGNGLRVIVTPMPGRELIAASLALRAGAVDEPADVGGATVLAARGLTEGTEVRDAIALVEAAERLGASLHAESGWDATSAGLDVPASRLEPALELLAEVVRRPSFPEAEIERLRDERLTDLLQAKADPRRRADEAYVSSVYASSSPYHRPAGGSAETVEGLTSAELRAVHARAYRPSHGALVLAGDVDPDEVARLAGALFGDWSGPDVSLTVGPRRIDYRRRGGAFDSASVRTTFRGLSGNDIVYGTRGRNVLRVDVPPHRVGKAWKMTVEGRELQRR